MKYEKGSFITVPNKHILAGTDATAQAAYLWVCSFANEEGQCWPSRSKLSELLGCSLPSVDKAINKLCELGILSKEVRPIGGNRNLPNLYQIILIQGGEGQYDLPSGAIQVATLSQGGLQELNPILTKSTQHGAEAPIEVVVERTKPDTSYRQVFKVFSTSPKGWMMHAPQIKAAKRLLADRGLDQIYKAMEFYREHEGEPYMVEIHTPFDLEAKWPRLFKKKETYERT